jgi:hypothetical protein
MLAAGLTADRAKQRFLCHACRRTRARQRIIMTLMLVVLIGAAFLLGR